MVPTGEGVVFRTKYKQYDFKGYSKRIQEE